MGMFRGLTYNRPSTKKRKGCNYKAPGNFRVFPIYERSNNRLLQSKFHLLYTTFCIKNNVVNELWKARFNRFTHNGRVSELT